MGRRWPALWRMGERRRRERGPGGMWRCLGERERREWGRGVGEARRRRGERESRGRECLAAGERERCRLWEWAFARGEPGHSGGVRGGLGDSCRVARYWAGGGKWPALHGSAG